MLYFVISITWQPLVTIYFHKVNQRPEGFCSFNAKQNTEKVNWKYFSSTPESESLLILDITHALKNINHSLGEQKDKHQFNKRRRVGLYGQKAVRVTLHATSVIDHKRSDWPTILQMKYFFFLPSIRHSYAKTSLHFLCIT